MNILIVGNEESYQEVEMKFSHNNGFQHIQSLDQADNLNNYDIIFDFIIHEYPEHYSKYIELDFPLILLNTVQLTLAELKYTFGGFSNHILGFNGLPSFVNREILEISTLKGSLVDQLTIPFDYELVEDRVGMVTPRIVLMIINEAYFTVQEGTATKDDIDTGMKLGTNYPYGPFEWCHMIGLNNVYETLEAIFEDTKDERYKIAPLLKQEYLLAN